MRDTPTNTPTNTPTQNQRGNSELNSELKPCPFCGGLANIYFDPEGTRDTVGRHWAYTVVCDRCCATSGLMFSKEMAAEVWNRRATDEN